ncbi:hypothetical protein UFOVP130_47 [uncultured Caudovirales phage]|uniref:Uncharacterized protein n=1 Tax=uncultured Caudovirales phage TaxID=2100421 RepID=A0A6J5LH40_9CAUD|nr:hypothetical protein UFOVP130_47 [uncultured Caudovirales phage]
MSLPIIRGASQALYPFVQTISFDTLVVRMQNGYEQRSARRPGLLRFEIPYGHLSQSQKNSVKAAVTSAKGQFDTGLTLTLGGTTYTGLSLDSDEFAGREYSNTRYEAPLKLSQTIAQSLSPGTAGTAFPALAGGFVYQLPATQRKSFQTTATLARGAKYTYAEFAGGLAGYPTDGLMGWSIEEPRLSDADVDIRIAHFVANWGMAFSFSFTDEDGTTYTKARYAMDELRIQRNGTNESAISTRIEVTNN